MKIKQARRLLAAVLLLVMSVIIPAAYGQDNLLANPGFEPPFEMVAGVVPGQIAQGWSPWSVTVGGSLAPEYYPASDTISGMGVPRILSGTDAQQYFSFFASHVGGVYQRVTGIAPGSTVTFSVNAWLWSSSSDDPDMSDPTANMTVEVGIDPTGGEDGASPAIIWSAPSNVTDEFVLLTIDAVAEADAVTVYVRSTVNEILMNNVVYLDDAALNVTAGAADMTAEATLEMTVDASPVVVEMTAEATMETTVEATVEVTETLVVELTPDAVITVEPTVELPTSTLIPTELPTTVPPTVARTLAPTAVPTVFVPTDLPTLAPTLEAAVAITVTTPSTAEIIIIDVTPTTVQVIEATVAATVIVIEPSVTPVSVDAQGVVAATPAATIRYVVQYGDSLSSIASRFRVNTRELARLNRIVNPNLVYAGTVLLIPTSGMPTATPTRVAPTLAPTMVSPTPTRSQGGQTYRVLPGDNLYGISIRYGVRISDLIRLNRIVDANRIYVGQLLQIP